MSGLAEGVAVVRQFQLPTGGKIDLVGVDGSGRILLVECKLDKNPGVKKQVVGQVLWYAAEISKLSPDEFRERFEERLKGNGRGPSTLAEIIKGFSEEEFKSGLEENLTAGTLQLLVVVDRINDHLHGIINYLNLHLVSNVQVVALELQHAMQGSIHILLPSTFGKELTSASRPKTSTKSWTLDRLRDDLESQFNKPGVQGLVDLLDWCDEHGGHFNPGRSPRIGVAFDVEGITTTVLMVSSRPPAIEVCFAYLTRQEVSDPTIEIFRARLAKSSAAAYFAPGVEKAIPKLDVATALSNPADLLAFKDAILELISWG